MGKKVSRQNDKIKYSELSSFNTPFYLYDFDKVERNISKLKNNFDPDDLRIFYSVKTNDHPVLLKFLKEKGLYAEVVSGLELELARNTGFEKILFNGPAKTSDELRQATEGGGTTVIIDNLSEFTRLQKFANAGTEIGLRLDLSGVGYHKFGMNKKDLMKALDMVSEDKKLVLAGLHFHAGSFIQHARYYRHIFNNLMSLMEEVPPHYFDNLEFLDIGGGIPCENKVKRSFMERALENYSYKYHFIDRWLLKKERQYVRRAESFKTDNYLEEYAVIVNDNIKKLQELLKKNISLYMEPGTAIVGDAVEVYSEVVTKKHNKILIDVSRDIERGRNCYWHPVYNITNPSEDVQTEYIFGPVCAPDDMFTRCYVGQRLEEGDRVKICGMGAYSFSYHSSFTQPQPAVVVKKRDSIEKVTDIETFSDKYRRNTVN
ncbi:MAG: alanine racemase [Elusimicrobiota bacterium]